MEDYIKAHEYSSNHMAQLKKDKKCGCFYCLEIFSPDGIDSIIGESSGYPITKEFLKKMKKHWF